MAMGGKEKQSVVLVELGLQCGNENDLDYW